MATVPYHTHNFSVPTATPDDMSNLSSSSVVVTPSNLGSSATQPISAFATAAQGLLAGTALQSSAIGVTIASAAQGAKADTALQPGQAATLAQGAKADTAMQPAVYDPENSGRINLPVLSRNVGMSLLGNYGRPEIDRNFAKNDGNTNDITISILFPRPATDCRGIQSACWVAERGNFYCTWKIGGTQPTEQIRISRHDRTGAILDVTGIIDYLGHGQQLDYVYYNGTFTLIAQNGDRRGVSAFEYVNGSPATITNLRQYIVDDAGVTSGGIAVSLDKKLILHSFSPYYDEGSGRNGKGWKLIDLNALLSGATGNRIDESGTLIWYGRQPASPGGAPEQGFAFDGVNVYQINSAGTGPNFGTLMCYRVLDGKLLWTDDCTPRFTVTGEVALTAYELEGIQLVVPSPNAQPQLWVALGIGAGAIDTRKNMTAPLRFGEIGAQSVNGNRAHFGVAHFYAGGTYKQAWFGEESFRRGVWRPSPVPVDGTEPHAAGYMEGVDIFKAYAGQDLSYSGLTTGNSEILVWSQNRTSGVVSMPNLSVTSVKATKNASQTITGTTKTAVSFETEVRDTDGAYNPTTGIFTAPRAGAYAFDVSLGFTSGVTVGEKIYVYLNNGTTDLSLRGRTAQDTANEWATLNETLDLSAGDTIQVFFGGNQSGNKVISSSTARTSLNIRRV